ncbi:MAG: hypothetical protein QOJ64_366 [Acidobacteriota bacterium]|jgi:hypothetical protein|nr:hypothetical protein [Acidobacteriota bacterium]
MLFALPLALISIAGGALVSYLFDDDAPLAARLCAGACIGFAALGLFGFVLASFFGFNSLAIILTAALLASPAFLLKSATRRKQLSGDLGQALGEIHRAVVDGKRRSIIQLLFYVMIGVSLWFVFDRAMIELPDGIYTGVQNNYGDLPFHISIITSFTDGANFPPEDPTWAGARFTYPFVADFVAACFVRAGASLRQAMFLENWILGMSFVGLLHRFALKLTRDWIAGLIAPVLVLFSGGLGWWLFFKDSEWGEKGIVGVLLSVQQKYTITSDTGYRWGNSLTTLLIPQRSILLGLPIAIVLFIVWWNSLDDRAYAHSKPPKRKAVRNAAARLASAADPTISTPLMKKMAAAGAVAGLLPLVHAHSLLVVMTVGLGVALLAGRKDWKAWAAFFIVAGLVAAPQLWWVTRNSSVRAGSFFAAHFGWDSGEENIFWFWFKNTGLFIPILIGAVVWLRNTRDPELRMSQRRLFLFCGPFLLCFIVPNLVKLAPWQWDNIKVIFYWFIASVPLVALVLARLLRGSWYFRVTSVALLVALTLAGALDVWSVASRATEFRIFDAEGVAFGEMIKQKTPPRATMLHAPTFDTPVFLTGRRTLMGYPGHIDSHGIEYKDRLRDIVEIYSAGPRAAALMAKYGIEYIVVGPQERSGMKQYRSQVSDQSFMNLQLVGEIGEYRLYKTAGP